MTASFTVGLMHPAIRRTCHHPLRNVGRSDSQLILPVYVPQMDTV
jgi:hypothetical protein